MTSVRASARPALLFTLAFVAVVPAGIPATHGPVDPFPIPPGTRVDAPEDSRGAPEAPFDSPDALLDAIYGAVTTEPGASPDWDRVRSMFLETAVVVLRTGPGESTVFSVDGFVADFVAFLADTPAGASGFTERIVRRATTTYGDLAHSLVLYEASIRGSSRPPQRGIDSFQLVRRDGRWWIVSITNERVAPDRPLPAPLRERHEDAAHDDAPRDADRARGDDGRPEPPPRRS